METRDAGPIELLLVEDDPSARGLNPRAPRESPTTRSLPVAVLACSREERDLAECCRRGASICVVKPVGFERFTDSARHPGLYRPLYDRVPR